MEWLHDDKSWKAAELGFLGELRYYSADGTYNKAMAGEDPSDPQWAVFGPGTQEIIVPEEGITSEVVIRMLNSRKDGIVPPQKVALYACDTADGEGAYLLQVKESPVWPNDRHDTFTDCILFEVDEIQTAFLKIVFSSESKVYMDKVFTDIRYNLTK